jgi:iron complex outermembrane receptor protein
LAGDRVQLTGGVLHYDTHSYFRNVLTNAPPAILNDYKDMWTASVLWKVRDNVSIYYSHSTNSSPTVANDQLLWRDGKQDEVGFKAELLEGKLSFSGAWFRIGQTNVTVPNPARQTDSSAPETLVSDFGNEGFEFEVIGSLAPGISALVNYSHLRMRDNLGRHVRGVADDSAAFLFNYRFADSPLASLSLTFGVNYCGRRAGDVPINFTPLGVVGKTSFYLEPYFATVLGASYRWSERYLFRLNIDNVLDDKGFIVVAGGRVSGTGITTQPGINVKLSTTIRF